MKKIYVSPAADQISVSLTHVILTSIDNTGQGDKDGEQNPVNPGGLGDDDEVGAKAGLWDDWNE